MPQLLVSSLRQRPATLAPVKEARDLTQEFFARLIDKHWLASADPPDTASGHG